LCNFQCLITQELHKFNPRYYSALISAGWGKGSCHRTARGNARADIYVDDDDRRQYLGKKTLCARENQKAFVAWAYLLRRVASPPL
jgi:hypothetical protein